MAAAKGSQPDSATAWELIRDDVFVRILDDAELERLVVERAKSSGEPHADLIRLMIGTSVMESEARTLWRRILVHRREMSTALGRPVHVRVAALDLLTHRPPTRSYPRDSRPIMVASSLLERALEEASSDSVTGLPRVAHFMNLLSYELLQRRRRVIVVFIDLDGFKAVNDEHGHAHGDEILRTMAMAARTVLRRGDVIARLGGDEFGLMLTEVSPEEGYAAVERLRHHFEELTTDMKTSFSFGLAVAKPDSTAEQLLHEADHAMYAQKRERASSRPPEASSPE